METLTANLAGNVRRELSRGREYIVAPVTLIVPGVLNGSQGPLYYPADEVERSAGIWNGVPVTLDHPRSNGRPITAKENGVVKLGLIKNSMFANGRLKAEAWLDVNLVNRSPFPDLLPMVQRGELIEVSTGLYTKNEELENEEECDGKKYKKVARNYRADHLAILLNQPGACSIADGCGLNQNHAQGKHKQEDHGNWADGATNEIESKILSALKDGPLDLSEVAYKTGIKAGRGRDPMKSKLNQSLVALRDSGKIKVKMRTWGDPVFTLVKNKLTLHHPGHARQEDHGNWARGITTKEEEKPGAGGKVIAIKQQGELLDKIKSQGGMTLDVVTGEEPEEGFAVSPYPDQCVLFDTKDITEVDVVKFLIDNDSLLTKTDHYFGPWREVDKDKGIDRIFLDVSVVLGDQRAATKLALDKDQKGIFNLKTKEYIEVDKDATSGGAINSLGVLTHARIKNGFRRSKGRFANLQGSNASLRKTDRQKAYSRRSARGKEGVGQKAKRRLMQINYGTFTLVNKEATMPLKAEDRRKIVDDLVESCCWEEDDRKVLNALTDEQLSRLHLKLEEDEEMMVAINAAVDTLGIDPNLEINELPEAFKKKAGAMKTKKQKKGFKWSQTDDDGDEDEEGDEPTGNEADWMSKIPKEAREDLEFARNEKRKRKEEIVEKLLANVEDGKIKKIQKDRLMARNIEDLEADLALLPEEKPTGRIDYTGLGGGSPLHNTGEKKPKPLAEPVANYDDLSPLSKKDD